MFSPGGMRQIVLVPKLPMMMAPSAVEVMLSGKRFLLRMVIIAGSAAWSAQAATALKAAHFIEEIVSFTISMMTETGALLRRGHRRSFMTDWSGRPPHMAAAPQATQDQSALIRFESRLSDSPFVERVWRCRSERGGKFISLAATNFEMALTRLRGKTFLTLRGPETKATTVDCPAEGEWLCIRFKLGTFMPQLLPGTLRDHNSVTLPGASSRSFWLNGSAWEYPDFENAETFVKRLVKSGVISRDPAATTTLEGQPGALSLRSAQRHFLRATGLTYAAFRQIERARYTATLLQDQVSIVDAAYLTGYFDQAHLTRSLKRFIGQTPVKIMQGESQLSFLYKTQLPR